MSAPGAGPPDRALTERMCATLVHRGPDGHGLYADDRAALGMRRLAIVDVAGGRQPVRSEDGTVVAVCNGELYNYRELRDGLRARGHRLTSDGDAECLVHLYEEHGDDLVRHLRGMFAFALWDARRGRLLLARDRVGKKPLYWRADGAGLAFASEAKALLADPALDRRLDPVALHHYLTYGYVPAPGSIFAGVAKLPPGHVLTWQAGKVHIGRYWRLGSEPREVPDEPEARLRELLLDAVRVRLAGERPVGAFLSGGVDSSAVVAAMARLSPEPVRTFSIGFADAAFDERPYARLVAERYGTEHHELVVEAPSADLLARIAWHFDEPFADSSAVPSFQVAALAAGRATVVLNGDGGDEVFGGYSRYTLAQALRHVPALGFPAAFDRLGSRLTGVHHRLGRAVRTLGLGPADRYTTVMSLFTPAQKARLYHPDRPPGPAGVDSLAIARDEWERSRAAAGAGRAMDVDLYTYLPGDLLAKVDVTTMAHSIEARSPLLDQHLMAFAGALPQHLKASGRGTKVLLRRALAGWLPAPVLARPKRGFAIPVAAWLRGPLRDPAHDLLTGPTASGRGLFDPAAVRALLERHAAGHDEAPRIWALMQLELWHRAFVDHAPRAAALPV
ncbi:asparagine synthase (glutamine-hydrolyzing) [Dactylosporangium matsuzakiense]|uniref:asparagine synthase (glutamine-hydrolyzing) n=1 Tax=Dactylosporangium matsuzakiense TaxID=53360 RepID=A0A9W6KPI5_9ACTN|nr:asparagine synthase (glutamine-hydrolyzing) [Dactylosporangium matsuzakiense]UWZ48113.1 asparagine synthase (glutamine-hydrolyzing) [Dactylosporangium matsuzakiense]GLL03129.1 asparagine synthetase B [Dactylosporangium matsuzakiense]